MEFESANKKWIAILSLAVLIATIFGFRFLSKPATKNIPERPYQGPVQQLKTLTLSPETITIMIEAVGRLQAIHSIQVISEVSGKVVFGKRPFKAGVRFLQGDTMLAVEADQDRYTLYSRRSQFVNRITQLIAEMSVDFPDRVNDWEAFLGKINIKKPLPALPDAKTNKEDKFLSALEIYAQFYEIRALEARLAKYTIKAPYEGVLVAASVNPGDIIAPLAVLGQFQSTQQFEVIVSVPVRELASIRTGQSITLHSGQLNRKWTGKIVRLIPKVEAGSQVASFVGQVSGSGLFDGMIVNVETASTRAPRVFALPRDYVENGQTVYFLPNPDSSEVRKKNVLVLKQGDKVLIEAFSDQSVIFVKPDTISR